MSYYQDHLFFCTNERKNGEACCANGNASAIKDYAKKRIKALKLSGPGRVRVSGAGCLGRCPEGPCLVIYPEGVWYRYTTEADIDEIIEQHLQKGQVVTRLMLDSSALNR